MKNQSRMAFVPFVALTIALCLVGPASDMMFPLPQASKAAKTQPAKEKPLGAQPEKPAAVPATKPEKSDVVPVKEPARPVTITHEEALELRLSDAQRQILNDAFAELQARASTWANDRAELNKKLSEKYKLTAQGFTVSPTQDQLVPR